MMLKVWKFLTSLKLAVVLIALLTILSIIATILPVDIIVLFSLGKSTFFLSPFFLIPGGLFFLNMLACTLQRMGFRFQSGAPLRIGPDIIHISLLAVLVLGAYSVTSRKETVVFLQKGESVQLPTGMVIKLRQFDFFVYPDGRPKDWLSHVDIFQDGEKVREYTIEVNKPLREGHYSFYQSSYHVEPLEPESGDEQFRLYSGLQIVYQPGAAFIVLALLLLCLGLSITFVQKIGDLKE